MSGHDAPLPTELPSAPGDVTGRLLRAALVVHSVWFPSQREMDAWERSGCPVYVRPLGPGLLEVGPRLHSMWASVFSPVLALRLTGEASTRVEVTRRLPHLTAGVLALWVVLVLAWGSALATGAVPAALPFWALVAVSTVSAPLVGWSRGGRALDAGVPWLREVLLAADDEEDW